MSCLPGSTTTPNTPANRSLGDAMFSGLRKTESIFEKLGMNAKWLTAMVAYHPSDPSQWLIVGGTGEERLHEALGQVMMKRDEPRAQVEYMASELYTTYCAAVGGVAFNGDPLPTWPEFSADKSKQKQVNAWRAAAITAGAGSLMQGGSETASPCEEPQTGMSVPRPE